MTLPSPETAPELQASTINHDSKEVDSLQDSKSEEGVVDSKELQGPDEPQDLEKQADEKTATATADTEELAADLVMVLCSERVCTANNY